MDHSCLFSSLLPWTGTILDPASPLLALITSDEEISFFKVERDASGVMMQRASVPRPVVA